MLIARVLRQVIVLAVLAFSTYYVMAYLLCLCRGKNPVVTRLGVGWLS